MLLIANTPLRESHYKKQVLRSLELAAPAKVTITSTNPRGWVGAFADPELIIRFEK